MTKTVPRAINKPLKMFGVSRNVVALCGVFIGISSLAHVSFLIEMAIFAATAVVFAAMKYVTRKDDQLIDIWLDGLRQPNMYDPFVIEEFVLEIEEHGDEDFDDA